MDIWIVRGGAAEARLKGLYDNSARVRGYVNAASSVVATYYDRRDPVDEETGLPATPITGLEAVALTHEAGDADGDWIGAISDETAATLELRTPLIAECVATLTDGAVMRFRSTGMVKESGPQEPVEL